MNFEDFGVVIEDPYAEQDPTGVDLWLKLLCEARDVSLEFYAVLNYLRGTGTLLQKDSKFGYRLIPVKRGTVLRSTTTRSSICRNGCHSLCRY